MKDFLKPTKDKIILSFLILVALNFYITNIPDTNVYFLPPQSAPFNALGTLIGEIILFVISYLVSCVIVAIYSMLKKK